MTDYGVSGIQPEPRAGFSSAGDRDRSLERFSTATWQRLRRARQVPSPDVWPTRSDFLQYWPAIAEDLLVADWKIAKAEVTDVELEVAMEVLLPAPAPARDWRELYCGELEDCALRPLLEPAPGQAPGDNLELVFDYAQLTPGERVVIRPWLYDTSLEQVAQDLGWRLSTVQTLYRNAVYRLRHVAVHGPQLQRRVVGVERDRSPERSRGSALQRAHAEGARALQRRRRAS